mgnify:CR=1 FL=1
MGEPPLAGKNALITGASRSKGIGAAIAHALASKGVNLFLCGYLAGDQEIFPDAGPDDRQQWIAALSRSGVKIAHLDLDISDPKAPARLFDAAENVLGQIDILVNNATYSRNNSIHSLNAEELDRHYAVNVRAPALLCAEFVRRFHGTSGGRIINLSSGQGLGPMSDELAYAATKGAMDTFTISACPPLAKQGITINAVDPGPTDTGWMTPELQRHLRETFPQGRIGQPEDAARLVCFLASPEAAWVTGQIIHSRGGFYG